MTTPCRTPSGVGAKPCELRTALDRRDAKTLRHLNHIHIEWLFDNSGKIGPDQTNRLNSFEFFQFQIVEKAIQYDVIIRWELVIEMKE